MNKKNILELLIAISILLIFYFLPTPSGLTYKGKMMVATLLFGTFLFITECLPLGISGLLVMIVPSIFGVFDSIQIFRFFGNEAVFFLIGAFILAGGFQKSGLHIRIARNFLKFFGKSSKLYIFGILLLGTFLSFMMSEHAVVILLLPIIQFSLMNTEKGSNIGKAGMISLSYGCSIGSIATLLGGARNPYTIAFLHENYGISMGFLDWMKMSIPVTLIMIPIIWFIITFVHKPNKIQLPEIEKKKITKKEIEAIGIIIFTISLLISLKHWGVAVSVIIGAALMFIFGIVEWKDIEKSMPWGIILLYGGAMTLGKGLQITGASIWIANNIISLIGKNPHLILFALILITVMMTEVMSHAAVVALMLPIGAGIASVSGLNIIITTMSIALAGGFGFALLIGTPGNLITYSTGYFRQKDILKTGIIADLLGVFVIFLVANTIWHYIGVW